jgi:hypothetical protein
MADHHDLFAVNLDVGHEAEIEQLKAELETLRQRKPRRRRPRLDHMIEQARKAGKDVSSVIVDGIALTFGEPEPSEAANPWLAEIEKATRQ